MGRGDRKVRLVVDVSWGSCVGYGIGFLGVFVVSLWT